MPAPGRPVMDRKCERCPSGHLKDRKHDYPDGLVPVGKFTWWRVIRMLGVKVIPHGGALRDVIAEIMFEAGPDGTDIRPSHKVLAGLLDYSDRTVGDAFGQLAALGLVYKAFEARGAGRGNRGHGRAAVYELMITAEHAEALEHAGYDWEWRGQDGRRKYLHAKKTGSPGFRSFEPGGDGGGDDPT